MRRRLSIYSVLIAMTIVAPPQVIASPVVYCQSPEEGDFVAVRHYIRDLRIYNAVENAWAEKRSLNDRLILTHCPSRNAMRIRASKESDSLWQARFLLLEMIADEKRQTLSEAAAYLERWNYIAQVYELPSETCMCSEDF